MRVSNRLDYAVRALIELALRDDEAPIAAREIATRRNIPDAFIHQVMASLARAGLIRSMRGPSGGHKLALPPERITIAEIAAALDADPARGPAPTTPWVAIGWACTRFRDVSAEYDAGRIGGPAP